MEAEGINKADALYELAKLTAPWDQELSKKYIDKQTDILAEIEDDLKLANLFQNKGLYHYHMGDYIKSLDNFNKSTLLYKKFQVLDQMALNYYYVVVILFNTDNLEKGYELFPEGLEIASKSEDPWTIAIGLYGAGYFYNNNLRDYEKSKAANLKAFNICLNNNLPSGMTGGAYAGYGIAFMRAGMPDSALLILRKAIGYYNDKKPADRYMIIQAIYEIGQVYHKTNQPDSAYHYYSLALKKAEEMGAVFAMTYIHSAMGILYLHMQKDSKAIHHFKLAEKNALITDSLGHGYLSEEYAQVPVHAWDVGIKFMAPRMLRVFIKNYLLDVYNQLSAIYEKQGNLKPSLYYLKKKHEIEKALNEISKSKELVGLQIRYETDKKDQQITVLSQQNQLSEFRVKQTRYFLFGLVGLLLLILALSILLIRQNKLKTKQKTILLEQKLLRSQMNPHFIFNALSNISNLIDKRDNETASLFLNRFSRMVRHILESTRNEFIKLDQEIDNIENYLALQKLRFTDKFDYKIEVDDEVDAEELEVPPMLIQPFVENAIEHGLKTKETKGNIDIRFKFQEGLLICEIDDDGVGRSKAGDQLMTGHNSMATKIVRDRLETLSKKNNQKLKFEIIDLKTESNVSLGTKVIVGLPYRRI
jgi:tetratricopeptide (TPR) repeat protein